MLLEDEDQATTRAGALVVQAMELIDYDEEIEGLGDGFEVEDLQKGEATANLMEELR